MRAPSGTRSLAGVFATLIALLLLADVASAACNNAVSCENERPGSPPSAWQVTGQGDTSIQGFATTMSVNRGETIRFKINTTANAYRIDIFRLGYYQGNGARLWASNLRPTASMPQNQPNCITEAATGLYDCGNWGVSASWAVPADAVSGIYIARLVRDDNGGASQIPFVVRDDSGGSDVLLKTSDATWHAYTLMGGNNLYRCGNLCPPGNPYGYKGAFAVSYNRPFDGTLPGDSGRSYLFYAEYQMLRFMERNGYDVSYTSQPDVAANPAELLEHDLVISSGHDEYWSAPERTAFENARDAGVNLAFFSGNEVFWKTRWAPSIDGSNTPRRTLVTYKDTHFTGPTDPVDWTGTWRDPRFARPGQLTTPENSLTGQFFLINAGTSDIRVPGRFRDLRLWRNTAVADLAANGSLTLAPGGSTLGYEWDMDVDNGFRPPGTFRVSETTVSGLETFRDYGTGVDLPTTNTHHMTMYRAPSGAIVFGAGTVQWAWGLDVTNPWGVSASPTASQADRNMQQMTVNLFADMGVQPDTLMPTLTPAAPSTDTTEPGTTITAPVADATINDGATVSITGTASDTGGTVAGVEVSTDNGVTWHPATGTTSWSYSWSAHGAPRATIRARAVDDSGNLETTQASVTVDIRCPCTMAGGTTPWTVDSGDTNSLEVGVRFKSDLNGTITGVRFYKAAANTGQHVGNLWSADGTLLARGTFSGESATGWQQLIFSTPVEIEAGTTYVASYFAPNGHYSTSDYYYYNPSPKGGNSLDSPPLRVLPGNGGGGNGVFAYTTTTTFPVLDGDGANYGVDVLFTPSLPPGAPSGVTATAGPGSATVSFTAPGAGGTPSRYIVTPFIGAAAQPSVTVTGSPPSTSVYVSGLNPASSYTFRVQAANANGTSPFSPASNAVTPGAPAVPGTATGLVASQGNGKVSLRWTPPSDGGRTITSYTVTPYVAGAPLSPTIVSGAPAPATATIPGLTNGTSYTFTVKATNVVGTGAESAPSNAVSPSPAPEFIQRMSVGSASAGNVQMTPTANVTTGNRIIVVTGFWNWGSQAVSSVSDSAGNTYTRVTGVRAPDQTELAVWTAPITAGGGSRPTITVTGAGVGGIGAAAVEYANLSTDAGAAAVDRFVTAGGTATSTGFVASGATAPVTGDNALALGFYVDSGFSRSLLPDPGWTERVNASPRADMEFVVEELLPIRGDTPNARVSTVSSTPWAMATVVFKTGAPSPPALAVSPASVAFSGTAGGSSPAAKTLGVSNAGGGTVSWSVSESAPWLSVSPSSGTNAGTVTLTPSITGLAAGTYTTDVTVSAGAVAGSPKVIPVTFTVAPPSPPVLSVSPASLAFEATTGGDAPGARTVAVSNAGGGSLSWTASEGVSWLSLSPASGTGDGTVTVTPSIAGLAAGTYVTDVTIAAPGVSGSPKTVAVSLTVTDPPACPVPPGLVGAWGFDEASGSSVGDSSPTANAGTISGALRSATGRFGGALSFDGTNDRVSIPDVAALDLTTGMTLEAWVSPSAVNDWRTVMLKERAGNLVYALYGSSDNGRPSLFIQTPLETDVRGTAALATNTWTHLASTYDGTTSRLFVNGVQVASRAVTGPITASTGVLSIGGNGSWGEWFAGMIDEVRVYNRALPAAEIASDMTRPVTCSGPPTLTVSPASLSFSGADPAPRTLTVSGVSSWSVSESASWLSVSSSGNTVTVTPSTSGLAVGTYTADVTVTAPGADGSPKTIPVTLTVEPPPPVLTVSPTSLSFTGVANASDPAAKTFDVSGTTNWTVSESSSWLSVSSSGGTVTVTPSIAGLSAGTYTADVTVTAPGATGSPRTVSVSLTLDPPATPPALSTSPASLAFTAVQGGASPATRTITVSNTGGGSLNWTASEDAAWLSLSPTSAANGATITATATLGSLAAGTYTADVTITAPGVAGSPRTIPVTFTVDPPTLSVSPASVAFSATVGGAAPAAQNLSVGAGGLAWTASDDAPWLALSTTASAVTLTPSITGLAAGTYTGTVTVTAPGAAGSPKSIPVTLTVSPAPTNLIGAWGFDEPSGTSATDSSGRGHTGTINGATRTAAGRHGAALSFDGTNDQVTIADTNALDLTNGMTLEAWIQPAAVGSAWRTVLLKEQPGDLIYSLYAGDGSGRPATHIFTTADRGLSGTAATPIGTWTHLAATYDGTTMRLYVNGTQAATRAQTGNIRASTGALRIGGNTVWSEWFSGLIDEVRIYNRALTAAEIQGDMNRAVSAGP